MATFKDLQYRQASTTKGAIRTLDALMAKEKDPATIAALSTARAAVTGTAGVQTKPAPEVPTIPEHRAYAGYGALAINRQVDEQAQQAAAPQYTSLTKPDPMSGDYWTVSADGSKATFNQAKFDSDNAAWQANMKAQGYDPARYTASPAGTVGQLGAGTDATGQVYSAIVGPDGSAQMLNAQQIQASANKPADPQTSRDRAAADSLVSIIKSWGLQDELQIADNGSITFPNPKALTQYTGLVSQRMLDVLRNGGTQVDALNAGGYQVVARGSDQWQNYAASKRR